MTGLGRERAVTEGVMRLMTSLLLAAGASALTACGLLADDAPPGGPPPALVEVAEVRSGALVDTWTVLGDVRALSTAGLAAGAAGPVETVAVREGDRVARGDLLVQVDPALAAARVTADRAAAECTRAQLEQARRDLARMERVDAAVMAPAEVERQRAQAATLEAQVASQDAAARQASVELERHRVRAPFAGVVALRRVDPGDWVTPGMPVIDLVSTEGVEIHVQAPADLAGQVRVGDSVTVHGAPGSRAEVAGVVPALDPVQRTALVRLVPTGEGDGLIPGLPVDVGFSVRRVDPAAVLVPRDALILGPMVSQVAVVDDDTARLITVTVLGSNGDTALVKGPELTAGQRVVVRGNERLRPGQSVKVVDTRAWTAAD